MAFAPPKHRPHKPSAPPPPSRHQEYDRWRGSAQSRGYDSTWHKVRNFKLQLSPLCERCQQQGFITAADMVHHKQTIEDRPDLRLDLSNLESLCDSCHQKTHHDHQRSTEIDFYPANLQPCKVPLHIVTGPPCAGKSHYVATNAKPGDTIIDLDQIISTMAHTTMHGWSRTWLRDGITRRNQQLVQLASQIDGEAWFIITCPDANNRRWWADQLKPVETIVLKPSMKTCLDRLKSDPERPQDTREAIEKWFRTYTARYNDVVK